MPLPDSVAELIERFEANRKEYHQSQYNETQTRIDFVNPLFDALGWDMDNRKALSEVQREVIHEDALKIGGTTKAPDYGFRAGGQRRFFLETKKPSVNLKLLAAPAYQLRRYAWTAKLSVSILTNFEEFAVYDGRIIPDHKDGPTVARLDYFKYTEMADRWDEITGRFSHSAVLSGAFDQYAAEAPGRKSFVPVDAAFLARISDWREKLARNIVANNSGVTPRELNYAVQMIIDRIIFLRISEDRGVETQYRLEPLQNGARVYPRLLELFRHADARYNSGLFHFDREPGRGEPDDVTPNLILDDRLLRDILGGLYGKENPYVFSYFPADILGQVYEQFLGKIIRVSGRTAEVEAKPEVKKAGGVYYTPTYIVRYIVENTVGKLVAGKTPAQVAKLTVLDPACGSGSFLLGAYQFLLDWHVKYYTDHDPAKLARGKKAVLYLAAQDAVGNDVWRLTTAEKKRILLANIYGVDIDTQAVEVTKLSLLLKVLEGESGEVLNNTLKLYQERVLPDLENNIQCGNSLIGPDFYTDKKPEDFSLDARLKINAFDWKSAFPKTIAAGGFDAVIGNPPYVSFGLRDVGTLGVDESDYYRSRYQNSAEYKISLYAIFIQAAIDLLHDGGITSYIVPDSFLLGRYFSKLRAHILDHCHIDEVLMIKAKVFHGATVGTSVVHRLRKIPRKLQSDSEVRVRLCTNIMDFPDALSQGNSYKQAEYDRTDMKRFRLFFSASDKRLVDRIEAARSIQLSGAVKLSSGLIGKRGKDSIVSATQESDVWKPGLHSGEEVRRYSVSYQGSFITFDKSLLKSGFKDARYDEVKILGRQTGDRLIWAYDDQNMLCLNNLHVGNLVPKSNYDLKYILSILNSKMMSHYYGLISLEVGRALAQTDIETLDTIPIYVVDFEQPAERAKHDKMVSLVEQMLKLQKDKAGARLGQEKAVLQQQIEATDAQIDRLVYDLYGLTEDEIKIVEAAG